MRWTPGRTSGDLEDRRGQGGIRGAHIGIGGTLLLLVLSVVFRRDLLTPFTEGSEATSYVGDNSRPATDDPEEQRLVQFVSFVLDDAQQFWTQALPEEVNTPYRRAKLVLFRDATESGCGAAKSATGPFYCPTDEKVYIDLAFYEELARRFRAPGEFAQAYVLAHEIGHHVQKLLGIEPKVRRLQERNPSQVNHLSVALELQADCFAGVWGNSGETRKMIDTSDVQSGLQAAAAIGDDRLQRMQGGRVSPESFTHGSSAERVTWFRRGLESGRVENCDTFTNR